MSEEHFEEAQKEFLDILKRIKHFLENGKVDTALSYVSNEYYILKNDLFANNHTNE